MHVWCVVGGIVATFMVPIILIAFYLRTFRHTENAGGGP